MKEKTNWEERRNRTKKNKIEVIFQKDRRKSKCLETNRRKKNVSKKIRPILNSNSNKSLFVIFTMDIHDKKRKMVIRIKSF